MKIVLLMACALMCFLAAGREEEEKVPPPKTDAAKPADAKDDANEPSDGEDGSKVQVGNLIYAGVRSSVCFSDHFCSSPRPNRRSAHRGAFMR